MKKLLILPIIVLAIVGGWYVAWKSSVAPHVERVNATIAYYNEQFKTSAYRATFKSAGVYASGFPFAKRVTIDHPNLAMVWGNQTYAVEARHITLTVEDEAQGRYSMAFPESVDALYAEAGKVPESYTIKLLDIPSLWARVMDAPINCRDASCRAKPEDVLKQIGFQPHGSILIEASLGGKSEKIGFNMMAMPRPIFLTIPADPSHPVSLFVGMLREALVFKNQ